MRDRNAPLTPGAVDSLDWEKMNGLLPAVVQDRASGRVLMLGYMNRAALEATLATGDATFWSRSKQRLWVKGETSGHVLSAASVRADCDGDALLVEADPRGPTCHLGTASCFGDRDDSGPGWLAELSRVIACRAASGDTSSYTKRLLGEGTARIAQKIGEEGVEVALAAVGESPDRCVEEIGDLLYHVAVLLQSLGLAWRDVVAVLQARHSGEGQ